MGEASGRRFPRDSYTPFGYLANPHARARSWSEGEGGNLRSTDDAVGFSWLYPWARGARARASLQIAIRSSAGTLISRQDFEGAGLDAPHHSASLFEYRWSATWCGGAARFVLVDRDTLGLEVEVERGAPRDTSLVVIATAWRGDGRRCLASAGLAEQRERVGSLDLGEPWGRHELEVHSGDSPHEPLGAGLEARELACRTRADFGSRLATEVGVGASIPVPSTGCRATALLRRVPAASPYEPAAPARSVHQAIARARARDDAFWAGAAQLAGDWPAAWRRGWVYDLETTRMCIFPPGGIFADVWPAWMIQWPRLVFAEGSLDTLRLCYADPDLAKRAALSMLRDAPAPNVPCVFQHGEPNMVALDGSICGTSPAWCVPFYNLERLYLRTLDRAWLAHIYDPLQRYLRWWLGERVDALGWAVYKCTWEAGEDDTPRLDPERRGDNVVSDFVRPVELQAAIALSAAVLARFAGELGSVREAARWHAVARAYAKRTQELWDQQAGRFRDWDTRRDEFLEASGELNYWGIDPCRHSVLSLTPLLAGLATEAQREVLVRELREYDRPPWTLWPSWTYVLVECAQAAGARDFAARVASDIVGRVYGELDRRSLGDPRGPTPGVAREFWPLDLATWNACEGYGWGATTASLLVRQIVGLLESDRTSGIQLRLAPSLPEAFLEEGRRYRLAHVPYRGRALDVEYVVPGQPAPRGRARRLLTVRLALDRPSRCRVADEHEVVCYRSEGYAEWHEFTVERGALYEIELATAPGREARP